LTPAALFISDLHLDRDQPEILKLFVNFLNKNAKQAEALYILGDLFEVWLGDDDHSELNQKVINHLRQLSDSNVDLFFMHGNRDFLIREQFAKQAGCTLLGDPTRIDLFGHRLLLMHGDTLCTGDHQYQEYRKMVRSEKWQQEVLGKTLDQRRLLSEQIREQSDHEKRTKIDEIMDVEQDTVNKTLQQYNVDYLIHGHTHRMNTHDVTYNGRAAKRIVLGDWQSSPSYIVVAEDGIELRQLN